MSTAAAIAGPVEPVRAVDLTVRFGAVTALDCICHDFCLGHDFIPGTTTAVMGPNGAGKTTLLECLAGLLRPSSGRVAGAPGRVAYVRQQAPAGWMPLTAREVLAMGRYRARGLTGRLRAADRAVMRAAADRLDVAGLLNRPYGDLSGGQRQRVVIAQALALEPNLLLLDEPISGLDLPSQERILAVLDESAASGLAVVITTHHLDEARHCHEVLLLANRLVAAGPPEKVLTPDLLRETFGPRTLGDHRRHDHEHSLLVLDDHGHSH